MNGYKIAITDPEHLGDNWDGPAPFEIEASATTMGNWPEAPVVVHVLDGTQPDRAAYLLRQVADALDRNGRRWLPTLAQDLNHHLPSEEVQTHLDRLAERGFLVEVTQYDFTQPNANGHCHARLDTPKTLRLDHNPSVRVEIRSGTNPQDAVKLLAGILKTVKTEAKKPGAFAPAPKPVLSFGSPDDEIPF